MLAERTFEIVFVAKGHPAGYDMARKPDRTVRYSGRALQVERARP